MSDQNMTIEDLAGIVGNLADEVRSGFSKMDAKIDKMATKEEVDEKIESLAVMFQNNFESLTDGLNFVRTDVAEMKTTLNLLDKKVDNHFEEVNEELNELKIRVNKLEDKVFVT